ncbi:MAG: class I SAM-dependent methyltransferase [Arenimonas sp.]
MHDDPAREVLLLPFATGALAWPTDGVVRFDEARVLPGLDATRRAQLRCTQAFKPHADELASAGYACIDDDIDPGSDKPSIALLLPPRQRDHARALLARALLNLAPGGTLVACQANDEGARSLQSDLARLCGQVQAASKRHCRVTWASRDALDATLVAEWTALDAPRALDGGWRSRPGVFAWDRIDAASALLIEHLPRALHGRAADLGAGTGVLAAALLGRNPQLEVLDLYEADARALALARENLEARASAAAETATAGGTVPGFHWHDVTAGLPDRYDVIVTNPPFHLGRADAPQLGRAFIAAAAQALLPGGRLWLVANRHLPYEAALAQDFAYVRELAAREGFKVIEARKAGGA